MRFTLTMKPSVQTALGEDCRPGIETITDRVNALGVSERWFRLTDWQERDSCGVAGHLRS